MRVGEVGRGFAFLVACGLAGCSSSDGTTGAGAVDAGLCASDAPLVYPDASGVNSGGCCRKIVVAGDCSSPILPTVCLRETRPEDTSGTGEIVTIVSPDGRCFSAYKGFTERLEGPGWVSDVTGKGGGYRVWGSQGLYETDVGSVPGEHLVCPDPPDAGVCP
ncbi:MAG TPA: hypothetical protein VHE30_04950 [Polyangiaceae bacterium]|nr:hypothetical protein [Polyangiaceae bacterium]